MSQEEYTLAVEDVVDVQVKFNIRSKGVDKLFTPTLSINRLESEENSARSEQSVHDFLLENVTGWKDQRLVLDAEGNPAPFNTVTLTKFLKFPGVAMCVWATYFKEVGAKAKN